MRGNILLASAAVVAVLAAGAAPLGAQRLEGVFQQGSSEGLDPSKPIAGDFLTQPPNRPQFSCLYSDPEEKAVIAENFVVGDAPIQIDEIVLRGYYTIGNRVAIDSFDVRFLSDSGGLPGVPVAPQEVDVPHTRVDTGFNWIEFDEYEFTLSLVSPVSLSGGTYWVEIYDITSASPDSFCWATGVVDPVHGIAGLAAANSAPGENWRSFSFDVSLELNGAVIPVELEWFGIE